MKKFNFLFNKDVKHKHPGWDDCVVSCEACGKKMSFGENQDLRYSCVVKDSQQIFLVYVCGFYCQEVIEANPSYRPVTQEEMQLFFKALKDEMAMRN